MKHHSVERPVVNFLADFFLGQSVRKSGTLWILSKHIWHSPLLTVFLNFDVHCLRRIFMSRFLVAQLHWQGRNWPGLNFSLSETFSPASFWRKRLRTQIFSEGKCFFVAFSWTIIPCMAFLCCLGYGIRSIGWIQFLAGSFLIFPQDFGWKFSEKNRVFK